MEELWLEAWPDVPFSEASPEDRALFLNHANSLAWFDLTRKDED